MFAGELPFVPSGDLSELYSFQLRASYLLDQDQVREKPRPSTRPAAQSTADFTEHPSLAVREPQASSQLAPQDSIFGAQRQLLVHCPVMYARKRSRFISSGSDT